jgi:hypothetical protein
LPQGILRFVVFDGVYALVEANTHSFSEIEQWVTSEQGFSIKMAFFGKRKTYSERRVYGDDLDRTLL